MRASLSSHAARLFGALLVGAASLAGTPAAPSEAKGIDCELTEEFAWLRAAIEEVEQAEIVGDCVEPPQVDEEGDTWQHTEFGLFVQRASDGWLAFTDREHTWEAQSDGVVRTLNFEEFPVEIERAIGVVPGASYFFVLTAQGGTIEPLAEEPDALLLTFAEPSGMVTVLADSPYRRAFQLPLSNFLGLWQELGFDVVPPHAAIVLSEASEDADVLVVELRNPIPSASEGSVSFLTRAIGTDEPSAPALAYFVERADSELPTHFGPVILFID